MIRYLPISLLMLLSHAAIAVTPTPTQDPRIRIVEYKPNQVIVVKVEKGVVTRVMMEKDERILVAPVGLSSDCKRETDEWCIFAENNQIFVRPRDNAKRNNMEVHTNKRDYSLVFEVIEDDNPQKKSREFSYFRVVFDYPAPKPTVVSMPDTQRTQIISGLIDRVNQTLDKPLSNRVDIAQVMPPEKILKHEATKIRNTRYTKQVLPKGEDAEPTAVFDDGRFTYFEFPGSREIPAVFAYGSDDQATRVNWHREGNFIVVQRLARKFTLRLGDAVVGVFNEAFDFTGLETPSATIAPGVIREIKQGGAQ